MQRVKSIEPSSQTVCSRNARGSETVVAPMGGGGPNAPVLPTTAKPPPQLVRTTINKDRMLLRIFNGGSKSEATRPQHISRLPELGWRQSGGRMNVADTADRAFVNFSIAAENLTQTGQRNPWCLRGRCTLRPTGTRDYLHSMRCHTFAVRCHRVWRVRSCVRAGQQGLRRGRAWQRCHLSTNRPYPFPGGRARSRDEDELYITASNKRNRRAGQERVWGAACTGDGSSAPSPVAASY